MRSRAIFCMTSRALCAINLASLLVCAAAVDAAVDPYRHSSGAWGQGFEDQWGFEAVHADAAPSSAGEPVIVAIIDTGLDYLHPDLAPESVWRNADEQPNGQDDDSNGYADDLIGWNFVDDNNNPWDRGGHGTHVAGIIAAATGNGEGIAGVAPNARIMPLKVMNFAGYASSTHVAAAILYAVQHGARVINLSLGSRGRSKAEQLALEFAERSDCVVVAAAGNEGIELTEFGPASVDTVLTVGAVDANESIAPFSNYGAALRLVAPGVDILSLRARRTDLDLTTGIHNYVPGTRFVGAGARYYRASGTSFAAPFVSAAAARLIAAKPELSARDVRRVLEQSARDVGTPGNDLRAGFGLLDVAAAEHLPDGYFIDAQLTGVRITSLAGRPALAVDGIANSDRWRHAWLELGAGRDPTQWRRLDTPIARSEQAATLATIPAGEFATANQWTLRLLVERDTGQRRESRYELNLN